MAMVETKLNIEKLNCKDEWISAMDAEEIYSISKNRLSQIKLKYPFMFKNAGKFVYVNIGRAKCVNDFRLSLWHKACDIYYLLTDGLNLSEYDIAKYISRKTNKHPNSWLEFISGPLFNFPRDDVFYLLVPNRLIEFVWYGSRLAYLIGKKEDLI